MFKGDFKNINALRSYQFLGTDPNPRGIVALYLSHGDAP